MRECMLGSTLNLTLKIEINSGREVDLNLSSTNLDSNYVPSLDDKILLNPMTDWRIYPLPKVLFCEERLYPYYTKRIN
jgi:hypothetical protein